MSRVFDTIFGGLRRALIIERPTAAVSEAARAGDYELLTLALLREERTISIDALIARVAEEVYRADLRAGAGVADIGVWGPALYQADATRAVCRMVGHALVLEDDGGPLAVQAAFA